MNDEFWLRKKNRLLKLKWKHESQESDFFDVRYKDKKFTREEVSKNGEFTEEFLNWVKKVMFGKSFDWKILCQENGMSSLPIDIEYTNSEIFELDPDIYLTDDGVIGLNYQYQTVEWSVSETKDGGFKYMTEQLHVNKEGVYFLELYRDRIELNEFDKEEDWMRKR